jgi:hypothetical protein
MNCVSDPNREPSRRRLLAAALALPGLYMPNRSLAHDHHARAAIKSVADFDATVWARLLREGPRPAAYVFTTTYCSTCPEVFELLHATVSTARRQVELAAVVMDAQGERALVHAHHYRGVTRLYAFNGFEPEIRQAVDPKWRNITPYVVLLDRQGRDQRVIGPPDAARLRAWLA